MARPFFWVGRLRRYIGFWWSARPLRNWFRWKSGYFFFSDCNSRWEWQCYLRIRMIDSNNLIVTATTKPMTLRIHAVIHPNRHIVPKTLFSNHTFFPNCHGQSCPACTSCFFYFQATMTEDMRWLCLVGVASWRVLGRRDTLFLGTRKHIPPKRGSSKNSSFLKFVAEVR